MRRWISPGQLARAGVLGMNGRNVQYISRYNARALYPLVDDKLQTKLLAQKHDVNVPELIHVIRSQREAADLQRRLDDLSEFVIKPAHGSGGKGILVITGRTDEGYRRSNGEIVSPVEIHRHVSNTLSGLHSLGGRNDTAIVEQLIQLDPLFEEVTFEGVPDIRLIIFQGYPVMGMLRLATHESDGKANLHQGAIGVGLDLATGASLAAVQHNRTVTHHPDTERILNDLTVPGWAELMHLAASCYEMTGLGYLGADIVLDRHHGPMLLELNARPGLSIQVANQAGLLPRLRHVERLESHHTGVTARVEHSMAVFGQSQH